MTCIPSGVYSANAIAMLEILFIVMEMMLVILFRMQLLFEVQFSCGVDPFVIFENLIFDFSR